MRCRSRSTACGKGVGSRPKVAALSKALMGLLRSLCEICHGNGWAFTRATRPCRASRCRGQAARGAPPRRTPTLRGVSGAANRHCPAPEALPKTRRGSSDEGSASLRALGAAARPRRGRWLAHTGRCATPLPRAIAGVVLRASAGRFRSLRKLSASPRCRPVVGPQELLHGIRSGAAAWSVDRA